MALFFFNDDSWHMKLRKLFSLVLPWIAKRKTYMTCDTQLLHLGETNTQQWQRVKKIHRQDSNRMWYVKNIFLQMTVLKIFCVEYVFILIRREKTDFSLMLCLLFKSWKQSITKTKTHCQCFQYTNMKQSNLYYSTVVQHSTKA